MEEPVHDIITLEETEEGELPDDNDHDDDDKNNPRSAHKLILFCKARRILTHTFYLRLVNYKKETVYCSDYESLEYEEYINDSIINFYLKYLFEEKLSESERENVHIFNSHFFSRLKCKPKKASEDDARSQTQRSYDQVKKWTKNVDLFAKKIIVIPVCEE